MLIIKKSIKNFYNNYYDSKNFPIYLLHKNIDNYIRRGYYGGRCECFYIGKIDEPIFYYDFTSLFQSEGRQLLPYSNPTYINNLYTYKIKTIYDNNQKNKEEFNKYFIEYEEHNAVEKGIWFDLLDVL